MKIKVIVFSILCCVTTTAVAETSFWRTATVLNDRQMSTIRGGFALDIGQINIGISVTGAVDGRQLLNSHIANLTIENGRLIGSADLASVLHVLQIGAGNTIDVEPSPMSNLTESEITSLSPVADKDVSRSSVQTETLLDEESILVPSREVVTGPIAAVSQQDEAVPLAQPVEVLADVQPEDLPVVTDSQVTTLPSSSPVIGSVIQNTQDGRHIEMTTLVDIEANVTTLIDRASMRAQIRDSIRMSMQQ